jgi:hypothetical protein
MNLSLDIDADSSKAMNDSASTGTGQVLSFTRRRLKPLLKAPVDLHEIDVLLPPKHEESTLGAAIAAHMGISSCEETECIVIPRDGATPLVGVDGLPILSPIKVDRGAFNCILMKSRQHGVARVDDARWMIYGVGDDVAIGDAKARKGYEFKFVRKGTPCDVSASYVEVEKEFGKIAFCHLIVNETTGEVFEDLGNGPRHASMDAFLQSKRHYIEADSFDVPAPKPRPVLTLVPAAPSDGGVSGEVDAGEVDAGEVDAGNAQPERGTMDEALSLFHERKPLPKSVRISLDIEVNANTAKTLCNMYLWRWAQVNGLGGEISLEAFLRKTFTDAAEALKEEPLIFAPKVG